VEDFFPIQATARSVSFFTDSAVFFSSRKRFVMPACSRTLAIPLCARQGTVFVFFPFLRPDSLFTTWAEPPVPERFHSPKGTVVVSISDFFFGNSPPTPCRHICFPFECRNFSSVRKSQAVVLFPPNRLFFPPGGILPLQGVPALFFMPSDPVLSSHRAGLSLPARRPLR